MLGSWKWCKRRLRSITVVRMKDRLCKRRLLNWGVLLHVGLLGGSFKNDWQSSGNQWLNPKVFVLESSQIRAGRFVLESGHKSSGRSAFRFVLEDMWLKPTVFVLESDHICAGRFVLKSARKSSRILSNDLQCRESGAKPILSFMFRCRAACRSTWFNALNVFVQHCSFRLRIWTQTETEPRSRFNSLAALIFHSRSLYISEAALQIGGFELQKGVKELWTNCQTVLNSMKIPVLCPFAAFWSGRFSRRVQLGAGVGE